MMKAALALVVIATVAGCGFLDAPVSIRTRARPDDVCLQARVGGILVADATYGLAFQNDGYREGVIWPFGYFARRESGVIVLVGPSGTAVAREGDRILAAGGGAGDDTVGVYCDIQVNPGPGA